MIIRPNHITAKSLSILFFLFASIEAWGSCVSWNIKDSIDFRFLGWTDDQYEHYEDSLLKVLYPEVIAHEIQPGEHVHGNTPIIKGVTESTDNSIPLADIDKSGIVGQIEISSGTSPSGAKTYSVPIKVFPGMHGMTPSLSLSYNSQQGNSVVGMGWSLSGVSMIVRSGKNMYYDGITIPVRMTVDDTFTLDGMRLIRVGMKDGNILYETVQGNIKAIGHISNSAICYFEVFYPDGRKAVFGYESDRNNNIYYPIKSQTDLFGNNIVYDYSRQGLACDLSRISYNGCRIEFHYGQERMDTVMRYVCGNRICEYLRLETITSACGNDILCTYTLGYNESKGISLLENIVCTVQGQELNPLKFTYGDGMGMTEYGTGTTQLYGWYESKSPGMIRTVRGKFDYNTNDDGLIVLPNKNPYFKYHRNHTAMRHSKDGFANMYKGDEKIYLYTGLKDAFASPMPDLVTGDGFVDILCASIDGTQEEGIIKVNNTVKDHSDHIVFSVYKASSINGLRLAYTRSYNFPTVYKDAYGDESIQPKFYYPGDFDGDGKMEILAVSCQEPFGGSSLPSMCYVFDMSDNRILYQGHVFPYEAEFVGDGQAEPDSAEIHTDKILVMDVDGDGKTDICHINNNGLDAYTFTRASSGILTPGKINTYKGLTKSAVANRSLLQGELNGDGLTDLLLSPPTGGRLDNKWALFRSTGDGTFDRSTFTGPQKKETEGSFILQDIDGDGLTELIYCYSNRGAEIYKTGGNSIAGYLSYLNTPDSAILVPVSIDDRGRSSQLVSLKHGLVTKYQFLYDKGIQTRTDYTFSVEEKEDHRLKVLLTGKKEADLVKDYTVNTTYTYDTYCNPTNENAVSSDGINVSRRTMYINNDAQGEGYSLGFPYYTTTTTTRNNGSPYTETDQVARWDRRQPLSEVRLKDGNQVEKHDYSYDSHGNAVSETVTPYSAAKGLTTSYTYDIYGRVTGKTEPLGLATSMNYDGQWHISEITDPRGNSTSYSYDALDRETKAMNPDGTVKETAYNWTNLGNKDALYSIEVSSTSSPTIATAYDALGREVRTKTSLFNFSDRYVDKKYNAVGLLDKESLPHESDGETLWKTYSYDNYYRPVMIAEPSGRTTKYAYIGNSVTETASGVTTTRTYDSAGNMLSAEDAAGTVNYNLAADGQPSSVSAIGGVTTTFAYDKYRRRTGLIDPSLGTVRYEYDNAGNLSRQTVSYTSFMRPGSIMENGYDAVFTYNGDYDRVKHALSRNGDNVLTKYYLGDCYEYIKTNGKEEERLYLNGDYYSAPAVLVKSGSSSKVYYILRDYLGSITHITDITGNIVQELSYDAWGRLRNPQTQEVYAAGTEPDLFLDRGYCGHEHLSEFGLINMNARLYDSAIGRFLSPDPYVQMPDNSQSLNRYSYCLNNPLKYNDKNGEFFIGFVSGFLRGIFQGKNPFKTGYRTGVNEMKLYAGLIRLDSNKSFLGKIWQLISRFTWELPQTLIGITYSQVSNTSWQVDHVGYWGGATVASGNNWGNGEEAAVTIGSFISGSNSLKADPNNSIFQHEYGHYLQSQAMGWGYLSRIAIPSIISAKNHKNHDFQPFEQDANRRAFLYFNKNVDGFYKTEENKNDIYGWNFNNNPLDINHSSIRNTYIDYKNEDSVRLLNNISLNSKWYDYFIIFGGLLDSNKSEKIVL